jgi:hypothetical protein
MSVLKGGAMIEDLRWVTNSDGKKLLQMLINGQWIEVPEIINPRQRKYEPSFVKFLNEHAKEQKG